MGNQVYAEVLFCCRVVTADRLLYLPDQIAQIFCSIEDGRALAVTEMWIRLIIIAMDNDGAGGKLLTLHVPIQIGICITVFFHEPNERSLKIVAMNPAIPKLAQFRRAQIESHVWRSSRRPDFALSHGKATNINDRIERCL